MKRLLLLVGFFTTTPMLIVLSSFFLLFLSHQKSGILGLLNRQTQPFAYAALPSNLNAVSNTISQDDGRVERVTQFFQLYNSPLVEYAGYIVSEADKYGIDYRLLPAISAQESGNCKTEIPGTDNCWGYGIYKGRTTSFDSYESAIDRVTRYFADLRDKGITTLDQIGSIYNPSDHNKWRANVASFLAQL